MIRSDQEHDGMTRSHASARLFWRSEESFALESGGALHGLEMAYRTWGKLSSEADNAIFICHPLTASSDADVWWPEMFGQDRAFDERRDFIVCANTLGSCYGSTSCLSTSTHGDLPYGPDFPSLTIRDQVRAIMRLADALGVRRIRLLVGASMGGLQAIEWALMDPERVLALVLIACSARHSAWCLGWSEAQRMAVRSDVGFAQGRYPAGSPPAAGLGLARAIAMQTYRNAASLERQFGRSRSIDVFGDEARNGADFAMRDWLSYHAETFVARFDANCYLTLLDAMDTHDVGRDRGGTALALAQCRQPALVVAISSDLLYRPEEQRALHAALVHSEYFELVTDDGHDGFLTDAARLEPRLRHFSDRLRTRAATEAQVLEAC